MKKVIEIAAVVVGLFLDMLVSFQLVVGGIILALFVPFNILEQHVNTNNGGVAGP